MTDWQDDWLRVQIETLLMWLWWVRYLVETWLSEDAEDHETPDEDDEGDCF